ncbi:hypothetical protein [Actinoplanes utahensis]|nr:hypothetical protein [Actinoplanes utahensis]
MTTAADVHEPNPHPPSRGELRTAARAVRRSELHRAVLNEVRPRGVSGVFRTRSPLALQLRLAAQQNRLLWWSPEFFAVLAPPAAQPQRLGSRWLRWLDRWWDLVMFFLPPLVLVAGGGVAAFVWAQPAGGREIWRAAALVCLLAAMAYVAVLMAVLAVRGFRELYRMVILGRAKEVTETGVGQVLATRWSMTLCHVPSAAEIPSLLRAVRSRAGTEDLLCAAAGITTVRAREALRRQPRVDVFTADPFVLIVRADPAAPLTMPPVPANITGSPLHGIPLLLAGMAAIILVGADGVAEWERHLCARIPEPQRAAACEERPLTYGDALYWLLNRLSGGDPEGLGARSFQARSLGLMVTLMSLIIVGWVITTLFQQAAARSRRFGQDVVDAYNETLPGETPSGDAAPPPSGDVAPTSPGDAVATSSGPGGGAGPGEPVSPTPRYGPQTGALLGLAAGVALGALLARRRR